MSFLEATTFLHVFVDIHKQSYMHILFSHTLKKMAKYLLMLFCLLVISLNIPLMGSFYIRKRFCIIFPKVCKISIIWKYHNLNIHASTCKFIAIYQEILQLFAFWYSFYCIAVIPLYPFTSPSVIEYRA